MSLLFNFCSYISSRITIV